MTYTVVEQEGQPGNPGTTRPLRGSARGRVFRGFVTEQIARHGHTRLGDCIALFNARYSPPMPHDNAVAIIRKDMDSGRLRGLPKGVIVGPAANGPILPLLKLCHPVAHDLFFAVVKWWPDGVPTRRLIDYVDRPMTKPQLYDAMRFLERQGLVRWDKAHANANLHHKQRAELLGGFVPTDLDSLTKSAPPVGQTTEHPEITAYFDRLKQKNAEDKMTDEELEAKKPSEPSIFD